MPDWGSGLQGAGSGALAGTAIMPGWGTAIGAGVGFLGGILSHKGKNREIKQQNQLTEQEYARRDAEQAKRASGRASFMMALLKAYGYEGAISEDQARAMLTGSQDRPVPGARQSALTSAGAGLSQAGSSIIAGSSSSTGRGQDFWDQLFAEIARKPTGQNTPPTGDSPGVAASGGFTH